MRTTLDIADDVLFAAKEMARHEKKSLGQVISDLARRAFSQTATQGKSNLPFSGQIEVDAPHVSERLAVYGICPLQSRGGLVSNELIDRLRDAEGI